MGLDTTHDCWHGPYSRFASWRSAVFDAAYGGGPRERYGYLEEVEAWDDHDPRREDPLMVLLMHSDCDGSISAADALPIAARLRDVMFALPELWHDETVRFIAGLGRAHACGEDVEFL